MRKKKRIDFVMIILVFVLLFVLHGAVQVKILNRRYVDYFGYTIFQVVTGSMEPTIMTKDIVVEKITKDVKQDDIITYKYKDDYVTHRIINQDDGYFITKGDNNNAEDQPVPIENVVGKVIFIIPNVAVWVKVIKTPQVIVAVVLTIIVFKLLFFGQGDKTEKKVKTSNNTNPTDDVDK